jgi:ketosteroid isomerase-like protein
VGTGQANPKDVVERLRRAMNAHDLEAHVACMHPDYRSAQPAHPNRGFGGREQVKKNWTAIYGAIPDFRAELLAVIAEGDTVWAEWHWTGNRADGSPFAMRGVTIFGVADDRIAWGRLYGSIWKRSKRPARISTKPSAGSSKDGNKAAAPSAREARRNLRSGLAPQATVGLRTAKFRRPGCREPSWALANEAAVAEGTGLRSGRAGSPRRQIPASSYSPAVPPACRKQRSRAVRSGQSRSIG